MATVQTVLKFTLLITTCGATILSSSIANAGNQILSAITEDDDLTPLLEGFRNVTDLIEMDRLGLRSSRLTIKPWSDTYWPTRYGGIAWRYADPHFPKKDDFKSNHQYFLLKPPGQIPMDRRSPAEKYDALLGDKNFTLTRQNWQAGLDRLDQFGQVLDWEGYCHGWSVAAYSEPEPQYSVTVRSVDGTPITFTPSDIKALTTLIYATGDLEVDFIGTKCWEDDPTEDPVGRNEDEDCLSTNPAIWHTAVVNRIALAKESFVMDVTYDAPIWNQPVAGYRYGYFNPQTLETTHSLAEAAVPVEAFPSDKFKAHRAPGTAFIVGVNMEVEYSRENMPSEKDRPRETVTEKVSYVYDLELDRSKKMLGGEWYSKAHPDFLWIAKRGQRPVSAGESELGLKDVWNGHEGLEGKWTAAAKLSSAKRQPIYGIVKGLLNRSQTPPTTEKK